VFISEGIQKFLYPAALGVGREARTDLSIWLACLFLLIVGAGGRSVDARLAPARPDRLAAHALGLGR
jgi:hypothetical protein